MAESLDDGEFWLPSEFLTDDDLLMDKIEMKDGGGGEEDVVISPEKTKIRSGLCFPSEFPYGFDSFSSAFSSPVESVGSSSTETESDEEDFLAGLTQQMVHTTLQQVEKSSAAATSPVFASEKPKTWVLSGSPQSTLCDWSGGSGGSSRGSPTNGPSQVSSPPTTPINEKDDAWELLYAAAGQVVRMKMNDEGTKRQQQQNHASRGLLGPPRKPSPVSIPLPVKTSGAAAAFPIPNQGLTQQQLQVNQFHHLKQQQQQQGSDVWGSRNGKPNLAPAQQQNHQQLLRNGGASFNARNARPLGLSSSAWPPLQPQHQNQQQQPQGGSGMRAVFLGGSNTRRETTGTGVFLPRRVGVHNSEYRKKPACSTVLLPARVVQALNLNFDDMSGAQQRFNGGYSLDHDALMSRNNVLVSQQKRNQQHQQQHRPQPVINPEMRLPQEWTY